jgi:CBS domain-containing protein
LRLRVAELTGDLGHRFVGGLAGLLRGHRVGKLIGIVSRRDLLSVFLRSDEEIAAEIREAIATILLDDFDGLTVTVRHGVATVSGALARKDLIPVAMRLASDVDGVVSVLDKLGTGVTPATAS